MKSCTVWFTGLMGVLLALLLMSVLLPAAVADAGEVKPLSITMEGYDYAYKVEFLPLRSKVRILEWRTWMFSQRERRTVRLLCCCMARIFSEILEEYNPFPYAERLSSGGTGPDWVREIIEAKYSLQLPPTGGQHQEAD